MKNSWHLFLGITLVSAAAGPALAVPKSCLQVHTRQVAPVESISTNIFIDQLAKSGVPEAFINRNSKIGWQTLDAAKKFKKAVQFYLEYYDGLSNTQRIQEKRNILSLINGNKSLSQFFKELASPTKIDYLPTQYELRRQLLSDIIATLKLLPEDLRPKISKIAFDERRNFLNAKAEELVQQSEASFDALLEKDGYTYAQLEQILRSSTDPYIQKAIQLVEAQLETGTYVRETGRFWTPKLGFQNVFVANTSAGGDTYRINHRHRIEASGTDTEIQKYYQLDDEIKPKYGVLGVKAGSDVRPNHGFGSYGSDYYVFKMSAVERRLSVYFGDSFGIASHHENSTVGQAGPTSRASNWRGRLIPWSRRLMLVPYLIENLESLNTLALQFENFEGKTLAHNILRSVPIESQIFGQLDLNMVESFSFRGSPPQGEFLKELQKRNITIYDARSGNRKLWQQSIEEKP